MTVTNPASSGAATGAEIQPREEQVAVTIDGFEISVPKGTLLIRAAELLGIQIPRFCDHPLLDPVGACRQCLVDVPDGGNGRPMPKPVASCTTTVAPGMVIRTQLTSAVADKAQKGVMELLLINHPLDCPVCDKGGECPLQNQAMSNGRGETRFTDVKRTFPKPIQISSQVLLDRERCVLCARCTRFSNQVAGDPFIEMLERGALQQVGIYEQQPFESYFSGNTVQICPVGALTGAQYRFRARPFDLVSTATACEHCASGCALRTDHRRGRVLRRLAAQDEQVNEEWNCDKGRWAFQYAAVGDRIASPMVRNAEGELIPTSWPDALATAAEGLTRARAAGVGVLVGGRVTMEDAYAYAKFARVALGTNDVDFRARVSSAEESQFLAAHVVGRTPDSGGVTYADLERAPVVLLAGLEPEEESPILFLRLRKAVRKKNLRVLAVAPFATRGLDKLQGTLVGSAPGTEPEVLDALTDEDGARRSLGEAAAAAAAGLRQPGAIVLVGERLAGVPGALSAIARLATATGSRLAWVPRRAGERGALEAGALPTLLPGGRPVADPAARVDVAAAWGVPTLPAAAGRDTAAMIQDAAAGRLGALVVGGVDPADLPDPHRATEALHGSAFVVSLEIRASEVSAHADVVLPVSPVVEKSGTFLDWEGRPRPFAAVLRDTGSLSDARVLDALAQELGLDLGTGDVAAIRGEMSELGDWEGTGVSSPAAPAGRLPRPEVGQAVLTTWHHLLDGGRLQDGEPFLAGTAKAPLARISPATAAEVGAVDGEPLTITGERATLIVPVRITPMPDRVVWLPAASAGADARTLGTPAGGVVRLTGPRQPVASGSSAPSGTSALSGSSALSGTSALEGRP